MNKLKIKMKKLRTFAQLAIVMWVGMTFVFIVTLNPNFILDVHLVVEFDNFFVAILQDWWEEAKNVQEWEVSLVLCWHICVSQRNDNRFTRYITYYVFHIPIPHVLGENTVPH